MPAQQFIMSRINQHQRLSRTSPATTADEDEDRLHCVHEYKKNMEDVKNEHPTLSCGAQQQLALKRCSKLQGNEPCHQQKKWPTALSGMMSKLRIGNNQTDDAPPLPAVGVDELGSTIGSTGGAEEPDFFSETSKTSRPRPRSLAVRQSVGCLTEEIDAFVAQTTITNGGSGNEEESLQDSLDNIERNAGNIFEQSFSTKSSNSSSRRRSSSRRHKPDRDSNMSRRVSAISLDLSDVEEDGDGSVASEKEKANHSCQGRRGPSVQNRHGSVTDILPDEIKIALQDFRFGDATNSANYGNPIPAPSRNRAPDRRSQVSNGTRRQSDNNEQQESNYSSFMSSFQSVDSANFNGDFSAWASHRSSS